MGCACTPQHGRSADAAARGNRAKGGNGADNPGRLEDDYIVSAMIGKCVACSVSLQSRLVRDLRNGTLCSQSVWWFCLRGVCVRGCMWACGCVLPLDCHVLSGATTEGGLAEGHAALLRHIRCPGETSYSSCVDRVPWPVCTREYAAGPARLSLSRSSTSPSHARSD